MICGELGVIRNPTVLQDCWYSLTPMLSYLIVSISTPGLPSPLNVQASQCSASAPVEVSWSPPSGGAATITGYRIFYGNGKNIFVSSYVTSIVFNFIEIKDELGETLSILSESTQLPSELVNVMVMSELCAILSCSIITFVYIALADEIMSQSALFSPTNIGIAVGVTTLFAFAAGVVTGVIFLLCWLRYVRWRLLLKWPSHSTNYLCPQKKKTVKEM